MPRVSKVSVYVREHITRKHKKAKPKFGHDAKVGFGFPLDTIFVLRYVREGKRVFETLTTNNYDQAKIEAKRRELELMTGEKPAPKEAVPTGHRISGVIDAFIAHISKPDKNGDTRPSKSIKSTRRELMQFAAW